MAKIAVDYVQASPSICDGYIPGPPGIREGPVSAAPLPEPSEYQYIENAYLFGCVKLYSPIGRGD